MIRTFARRARAWLHVIGSLLLLMLLFAVIYAETRQPLVALAVVVPATAAWARLTLARQPPPAE